MIPPICYFISAPLADYIIHYTIEPKEKEL